MPRGTGGSTGSYGALRRQFPATVSNSWRRMLVSREIYDVWQYPPLIGIIRQLLGDELYASSIRNGRPRGPDQPVQTIDLSLIPI